MPSYDYYCEANGQTLEVRHKMNEQVYTWGQLCEITGSKPGETPLQTPVKKLATGGQIVRPSSLGSGAHAAPPCETNGVCCGGGMCDF